MIRRLIPRLFRSSLLCAVLPAVPVFGASNDVPTDWPQFRGLHADGVSVDEIFAPLDAVALGAAWKRGLGSGYSGVSVSGERVVAMFQDGDSDVAVALDAGDGTELWRYDTGNTFKGRDGSHDGPMATPVIAESLGLAVGLSGHGRLFALSLDTGEEAWSTSLVEDHGARAPHYGFATSPLLMGGTLVVQVGAEEGSVAGFDPRTGERRWLAGGDAVAYQSPIAFELDGRRQVVAAGMKKLFGMDAASGEILWEYEHEGQGPTGVASMVPVPAGDGRLFLTHKDTASSMIRLETGEDGAVAIEKLWEDRSIRNSYTVPVYHDGYVYAFSSRFLTCVDAATGKSVWKSRAPGDGFLILVDGHLVILTKQGSLHVAKASPEGYEEVADLGLFDELAWTAPSFAAGSIFVRSFGALARVDVSAATSIAEGGEAGSAEGPSATGFAGFLASAEAAGGEERTALIDRFMIETESFPIIEEDGSVHFVYRGAGDDLAIAGDMIGARQERPMTRLADTDVFYYSTRLEPDARVNYLFMRDFAETLVDEKNPRKTTTVLYTPEMEMSFSGQELEMSWLAMPGWTAPDHLGEPAEASRGRVESHELESALMETKHPVEIYLPVGYDESEARYPVAIVHGGSPARERSRITTTLDNLIGDSVEPVIAVFVNLQSFPDGNKYAQAVAEEIVPFVDETYRTIATAESRANVGAGFSAYAAFYTTLKSSDTFGKVGAQSIFMLDSMQGALEPLVKARDEQPLDIYVEWGRYDMKNPHENWDMSRANETFVEVLRQNGHEIAGGEVNDGTGWSSWRNRNDVVLETLFPISDVSDVGGAE